MCETLLRGVYKKIFFNPGLADSSRGEVFLYKLNEIKMFDFISTNKFLCLTYTVTLR